MSGTNGTALPTSKNSNHRVTTGRGTGTPADYVTSMETTAPLDLVDMAGAPDDVDQPNQWGEIEAMAARVAVARGRMPLQAEGALMDALSDEELVEERKLVEWERGQRRDQRRKAVKAELAQEERDRANAATIAKQDAADGRWHRRSVAEDERWHRRAMTARKRVTSPHARLAKLHRNAALSARALVTVVILGMAWSGVNVQRNLVPDGDITNPLWWLSYGVEAMISVPIVVIMIQATTSADWGQPLDRRRVVLFEVGLLMMSIGLNVGPHIVAGRWSKAAEFAVAPLMVGVVIWLHAWVSGRYAHLIATAHVPGEDEPGRLGEDTAGLLDAIARVQAGMAAGLVKPSELNKPGEVSPSASKIAAVFGMGKGDAGLVRDAINRLAKNSTT